MGWTWNAASPHVNATPACARRYGAYRLRRAAARAATGWRRATHEVGVPRARRPAPRAGAAAHVQPHRLSAGRARWLYRRLRDGQALVVRAHGREAHGRRRAVRD